MSPETKAMLQTRESNIKQTILDDLRAGLTFDTVEANIRTSVENVLDSVNPECNGCTYREQCVAVLSLRMIADAWLLQSLALSAAKVAI